MTYRNWFSRLVRDPPRKRSGSILTTRTGLKLSWSPDSRPIPQDTNILSIHVSRLHTLSESHRNAPQYGTVLQQPKASMQQLSAVQKQAAIYYRQDCHALDKGIQTFFGFFRAFGIKIQDSTYQV